MSRSSKHFEEFKPHSKHKHLILQQYFLAWGHKLGLRAGAGDSILYVDACAGRGADDIGNHGSPLIAAAAAAIAQTNIRAHRQEPFNIRVVAIESKKKHYSALVRLLAPFGTGVCVLKGTLGDHLEKLENEHPDSPTLYFIDPFGLEPLEAAVVERALHGERHEALLLFADQAALRHFGAITTEETRAERRLRRATSPLPLFPDLPVANAEALADAAVGSRAHLEVTRESAIRIMNAAFGDQRWLPVIEAVDPPGRRGAILALYAERLRSWGATHILRIPVVDDSGTRAYTLIHASKSPKAFAAMKEAVSYALDRSPLPPCVVDQMRDLVRSDPASVETAVRVEFAGQTARWAEDPNDRRTPCVKNYVLEATAAFPFELPALKDRLKPLRVRGRAIVYSFPEV